LPSPFISTLRILNPGITGMISPDPCAVFLRL
jgi:hypothetical protein